MGKRSAQPVLAIAIALLLSGCATQPPEARRTQVVTFPANGIVFYNGEELGNAPALITLPQDQHGRLIGRATVQVIPQDADRHHLRSTARVFQPGESTERVPDRILLDMSPTASTNFVTEMELNPTAPPPRRKPVLKYTPRSKPTQVVGID